METKTLLSILLICLLIFSVSFNMIIPSNDNAKENSQVLENSRAVSEISDGGWSVEVKNRPCNKDYCI